MGLRHSYDAVRRVGHFLLERLRGQCQHLGSTGLYLHHVAHGLVKERLVGAQGHHQRSRLDEGNGAVLQLAGGIRLGVDIADLLQLQGAFQAHGVVQIPADEEDGIVVEVPGGEILHILDACQHPFQLFRQDFQLVKNGIVLRFLNGTQQIAQIQGDEVHQDQLSGVSLRGSHGDLRTGPGIEHIVRFTSDGGAYHIHHCQCPAAAPLGLPQGGHSIQRLTGLTDENDQRMIVHQRVAVAEFRGQTHLHRAAEQALPVVLADHAHMVAGPAGHDENTADALDVFLCQAQIVQHHPALPDPGRDGFPDGLRLLEDLLEHKVGVAALFRSGNVPVDVAVGLIDGVHLVIEKVDALRRQHGDLAVLHVNNIAGMADDGSHVGGNEILVLTAADDKGAVLPSGDQGVGIVGTDDAESIGAFDPPQDTAHGLQHIMTLVIVEFQQLSRHLGVRFRLERNAVTQKLLLDLHIVFDDAVMDHGDPAILTDMGMGVDVIGLSMGSPAGMADAQRSLHIGAAVDHI